MIEKLKVKQYAEGSQSSKPYLLYIYRADGRYTGSVRLNNEKELKLAFDTQIIDAIKEKRQVRITDTGDMLLFHSFNGCTKWDGMNKHECDNCKEPLEN